VYEIDSENNFDEGDFDENMPFPEYPSFPGQGEESGVINSM